MKTTPNHFRRFAFKASLPLLLVVAFADSQASAATDTWTKTTGSPYSWNDNSNWGTAYINAAGDTANLNVNYAAAQTINLNTAITVGTLNLGDTTTPFFATTIAKGTSGSLIMDNSGSGALISKATVGTTALDTISANITLNDNLTVTNAATSANGGVSLSGNITETGGPKTLTKNGAGILTLTGTNTFTGGINLSAGTLILGNNAALGTGTLTIGTNPTLKVTAARTTTNNNAQIWTGGTDTLLTYNSSNSLDFGTGAVTMTGAVTWQVKGSSLNIGGSIGDGGSHYTLAQYGGGTLILSGANTYTGMTSVVGTSYLRLNNTTALAGGIGKTGGLSNLRLSGGVVELTSASGDLLRSLGTAAPQVQLAGVSGFSAQGAARTVRFNDTASELTWGSTGFIQTTLILNDAVANAKLTLDHPIDLNGAARIINVGANTAEITGNIRNGSATAASLTKTGPGTLNSPGANSYDGATNVNGGALVLGGANTGGGAVTVATDARLGGNGSTTSAVTVHSDGGLLANITNWAAGTSDKLTVASLSLPGTWTVDVSSDTFTEASKSFTILTSGTEITGFTAPTITGTTGAGNWSVQLSGDSLSLKLVYSTGAESPYDTWKDGTFANAFTDTDPTHDPDGDGVNNFNEFAFGLDPTTGASVSPITDVSQLQSNGKFSYTRYATSELSYTVLTSTDLQTWVTDPTAAQSAGDPDANGVETVVVTFATPPTNEKFFVRVKAE